MRRPQVGSNWFPTNPPERGTRNRSVLRWSIAIATTIRHSSTGETVPIDINPSPILAFIQPDSPSERLLAQSGVPYRCVYTGSTPEAIDEVVAEIFSLPCTAVAANSWFEEHFNAENQTRILDIIIRSLDGGPGQGTES